jgi:hypothetical protein
MSAVPAARQRGTLPPERPAEDALQCVRCGGWFLPNEEVFGCPGCHQMRDIYDALVERLK